MFTDWQQLAAVVAVLTGIAAGLRFLFWVSGKFTSWMTHMFGIGDIKTDLAAVHETLQTVVTELQPNGGASIRDSLNRIELRQVFNEQRQRAILTDMSVGVFETDVTGNYIWVNRKYLRMTGRAPNEVNGSGWVNTVAERDRPKVMEEWQKAIDEEREYEGEHCIVTPDGMCIKVSVRTYKMVDSTGSTLGFMGVMNPALGPEGKPHPVENC